MKRTIGDIYIAGSLTTEDWEKFRDTLTLGGEVAVWEKAFLEYFKGRLSFVISIRLRRSAATVHFKAKGSQLWRFSAA